MLHFASRASSMKPSSRLKSALESGEQWFTDISGNEYRAFRREFRQRLGGVRGQVWLLGLGDTGSDVTTVFRCDQSRESAEHGVIGEHGKKRPAGSPGEEPAKSLCSGGETPIMPLSESSHGSSLFVRQNATILTEPIFSLCGEGPCKPTSDFTCTRRWPLTSIACTPPSGTVDTYPRGNCSMDPTSEPKAADDGSNANTNSNSQSAGPSQLACVPCRRKHLKCDARSPVCTRCATSGNKCFYTPSRRGYKGPSKRQRGSNAGIDDDATWALPGMNVADQMQFDFADFNANSAYRGQGSTLNPSNSGLITTQATAPPEKGQYLVDMYFHNFHAAHPILLPPVAQQYAEPIPDYLELVTKFIGSHFADNISNDTYRHVTASAIANNLEKDAYKVQALLLFAIALHARNEQVEAVETLSSAVDLALEIGMNREAFAYMHGGQDANREESLRRTWWELYVVDGMLAALHQKTSFKTDTVEADVPFPCEDSVYEERVRTSHPPKASHFYNRIFADEEENFASFCYRIEAVRILGRILAVSGNLDLHDDKFESVDSTLAGWFHHLPRSKTEVVNAEGVVDEMLFQAHFIIHCASIYLHFPRSNFLSSPAATADVNTARRSCQRPCASPASSHHAHAAKAIKAANALSNLASLRLPVNKHTPFFVCGLVLSALVQVSACSDRTSGCLDQHRDRIILAVGVLKSLGQTWLVARRMMQQVKTVANEVPDLAMQSPAAQTPAPNELDFNTFLSNDLWLGGIPSNSSASAADLNPPIT